MVAAKRKSVASQQASTSKKLKTTKNEIPKFTMTLRKRKTVETTKVKSESSQRQQPKRQKQKKTTSTKATVKKATKTKTKPKKSKSSSIYFYAREDDQICAMCGNNPEEALKETGHPLTITPCCRKFFCLNNPII